jgi:hypothetical protein
VGKNAVGRGWYQEGRYVEYVVPNRGLISSSPCHLKCFDPYLGGHEAVCCFLFFLLFLKMN